MTDDSDAALCPACDGDRWVSLPPKQGFQLYRCQNCRLIRAAGTWPRLDHERSLQPDYRAYLDRWLTERESSGPGYSANRRLDLIERWVRPGQLIDVGCGVGDLLAAAGARGWDATGIEPYAPAARVAQKRGLRVERRAWEEIVLPQERLAAVVFLDSLEHLAAPLRALRVAAVALRPGGVVAITTPDADSWLARLMGRRWPNLFPLEHRFCFTRRSLRLLIREARLRIVDERRVSYHRPLGWLLHKVGTGGVPFGRCSLPVPLPVGDLLCLAVKP
jgi:SAM-dependent methyltransferase